MDKKPKRKQKARKCALSLHKATGQYCKRHKGKVYYFGRDLEAALKRFAEEWPAIVAGQPRPQNDCIDIHRLCNAFLQAKRDKVESEELSARTWSEYHRVCEFIIEAFGKTQLVHELRPDDFGKLRSILAKRYGPNTLNKSITFAKSVFSWAFEAELLKVPVRYGSFFDKPPKRALRLVRAMKATKFMPAADIRTLLDVADEQMKAMILLGINCGFGPMDCSSLPRRALTIKAGWIDHARPKTGIGRRVPLWPETIAALDAVAKVRPTPKHEDDADLVFITKYGNRWIRTTDNGEGKRVTIHNPTAHAFKKLCAKVGVNHHGGPYVLRHTFLTVADEAKDRVAIGRIMGHVDDSIASYYLEIVSDERLQAVVGHVRRWLFGESDARME